MKWLDPLPVPVREGRQWRCYARCLMKTILWMKTESANRLKCGTAGRCKLRMNRAEYCAKGQGKARTSWVGYKVQVAESIGEEGS